MPAGATFENIQTYTFPSDASSVTFNNISQAYTDLILVATSVVAPTGSAFEFQCGNGTVNTSSIYSRTFFYATATTFPSGRSVNLDRLYFSAGDTAGVFGQGVINIQNYSSTTLKKTIVGLTGDGKDETVAVAGLFASTAAINTIGITGYISNISAGSTFTLYGIKSA